MTTNFDTSSPGYRKAVFAVTVLQNKWIPYPPHPRQADFLALTDVFEILYGGQAGGGKSAALLMAALQFVEVPDYKAVLFRKSLTDLQKPGALIDLSHAWLGSTEAKWDAKNTTWRFPSGAVLAFGYLDKAQDKYSHQSTSYNYIGFDELTQFKQADYLYLFSRLRRSAGFDLPSRVRAASNPGGDGHGWVKKRFLSREGKVKGRVFIPARLEDNPTLDADDYRRSMEELPLTERRQLMEGDWSDFSGEHFKPADWPVYLDLGGLWSLPDGAGRRRLYNREEVTVLVTADWATSDKKSANCTAFGAFALTPPGELLVLEVVAERWPLERVVPELEKFCLRHKPDLVAVEASGFQGALALECRRYPGIPEVRRLSTGSARHAKVKRALPAILLGENGRIYLPESSAPSPWLEPFVAELSSFTGEGDEEDDRVDVVGYAGQLAQQLRGSSPQGEDSGPCVLIPGREAF